MVLNFQQLNTLRNKKHKIYVRKVVVFLIENVFGIRVVEVSHRLYRSLPVLYSTVVLPHRNFPCAVLLSPHPPRLQQCRKTQRPKQELTWRSASGGRWGPSANRPPCSAAGWHSVSPRRRAWRAGPSPSGKPVLSEGWRERESQTAHTERERDYFYPLSECVFISSVYKSRFFSVYNVVNILYVPRIKSYCTYVQYSQ